MAFLVATTSLPAVYRPNGYARTTTARANSLLMKFWYLFMGLDILIPSDSFSSVLVSFGSYFHTAAFCCKNVVCSGAYSLVSTEN